MHAQSFEKLWNTTNADYAKTTLMCLCRILHIFHLPECLSKERSQVRWKMQTVWTFLQNAWIGKGGDEVKRAWLEVVQKCFLLFQTLVSFSFRLLGGGIFGGSERGVFKKNSVLTQIRGEKGVQIKKARQQEVPQNKYAGCKGRCFIFQSWPLCAVRRKKLWCLPLSLASSLSIHVNMPLF